MGSSRIAALGVICAAAASASLPATGLAASGSHGGTAPKHGFGRGTSTNWSGYAVSGSGAAYVIGTWTQPTATCSPGENRWSSPWVGIDGDTTNTVEQIGTDSDCVNGAPTYYAWWEMYPKGLVQIAVPVQPGHRYTGEVTALRGGSFRLGLRDGTTGAVFSTVQSNRRARAASIEWIMEGPSNGLLSNFGSVAFSGASGTLGGLTAAVDGFANRAPITMVTGSGTPRAIPSTASSGGFSVVWQHA